MYKTVSIVLSVLALQTLANATQSFNFEDPKGVNTIRFTLDAPLESISGTTNGVTGNIDFDIDNPEQTSGTIQVDATSITVPNPVMQDHIHGEKWLNTSTNDKITFTTKSLANVVKKDQIVTADVKGTFTLNGVSKELSLPVTFTYLKGKLADRSNGQMEGDLLVLRANFSINRSEFGIMPGQATDKVAEEVFLTLALAGYSQSN